MNKIIFQLGLLSFCISSVVYASLGMSVIDVIARAFIIFIATIGVSIGIIFLTSMVSTKEKDLESSDTPPKAV